MGRKSKLRKKEYKNPKKAIYIFTEGEKTEPEYFEALKTHANSKNKIIKIFPIGKQASELLKNARAKLKYDGTEENIDELWLISDKDDITDQAFKEFILKAERLKFKVGYSIPCFELWLILHFENYNKYSDQKAVQKHLSDLLKSKLGYQGNCKKIPRVFFKKHFLSEDQFLDEAVQRAKAFDSLNNPSTTMHEIIAAIMQNEND